MTPARAPSTHLASAAVKVIGVGNDYRGDDAVGRVVARRLKGAGLDPDRVAEESGEGAALMEAWKNAGLVILIDAVHSGQRPGTIHRFDARAEPIPSRFFHYSTHAFSVAEAVELARALDRLPPRLIVYGIEGRNFDSGEGLSDEVNRAAGELVSRILQDAASAAST